MHKLLHLAGSVSLGMALFGCVIETTDSSRRVQQTGNTAQPPPIPPPTTEPEPLVVEVDLDRTMTAKGGEGVGVFVEYSTGGKWHLFWTCDTAISGQPCTFLLRATAHEGELSVDEQTGESFEFESLTRTEINEVYIDAIPGADLEIEAIIGGEKDSRFFFFVQDGVVKGDYTGILTNPLIFRPKIRR